MEHNLTRDGIAYNLEESPYTYTMEYGYERLMFHFSSELYLSKFCERYIKNREEVNNSLTKRFKIEITNNMLADLRLYANIEKRGFYIASINGSVTCLSDIRLDGLALITKN